MSEEKSKRKFSKEFEERKFKKGQTGNPNGRYCLPPELHVSRRLNRIELEKILNKHIYASTDELKKSLRDGTISGLEAMVVSIILKSVENGDQTRLNFLLERLVGKVADKLELTGRVTFADLIKARKAKQENGGES